MAIFGNNPTTKDVQYNAELGNANTHLAKGAIFKGDLETYGTIRLEGRIIGNVIAKSKVSIGETAVVEGNILAQNAEIAGEVNGKVEIVDILTLKSTANINGNITCNKLIIESGAVFNGKCQMGNFVKEIVIGELTKTTNTSNKIPKNTAEKANPSLDTHE
ncbi:MAG: polymer-forming cytoskeletal protein [Microscillaceae bacterium]|jgi:cytoskeletal protein CcmA (bactofilin family)|nr:polymer-forming cytoskeletal protein [Microscillaceae bacterium]